MVAHSLQGLDELRQYRPRRGISWALVDVIVIDGTGGPAFGPAHIVIRDDKIIRVIEKHNALSGLDGRGYHDACPDEVAAEDTFCLEGMYVLPGFIDAHAHIGAPDQVESKDYVYKLWLGHGITRVREVGSLGIDYDTMQRESSRSFNGELEAPKIHSYLAFGAESSEPITTGEAARQWVAQARERGAEGVKFFGAAPHLMRSALDEAGKLGMGTACHHSQQATPRANAQLTAQWGLRSIEHSYGQAEVMYQDRLLPEVPPDFNYSDERMRFAEAGRLWTQGARRSEAAWTDFVDELVSLKTTLVPTFTVYTAARDAERARNREWVRDYVTPQLKRFFTPCQHRHGSFFSDWTTEDEVAWKKNYQIWMSFVEDFSLRGGRVCIGSDAGFIHSHYGFSYIDEMELMREVGMSPLQIIRAATLDAAGLLDIDSDAGSIEAGKIADLVIVGQNPLSNLKVLYGHGHYRPYDSNSERRVGGIDITINSGRITDSRKLLAEVREFVSQHREDQSAGDRNTEPQRRNEKA